MRNLADLPVVPSLFYSTWGSDFYSEHWLTDINCWMFALVKFVEANIDLDADPSLVRDFERFAASDYLFSYPDESQRERIGKLFIEQYTRLIARLKPLKHKELAVSFPVDPFKSVFLYVTVDKPAKPPEFHIHKLSRVRGSKLQSVTIEPSMMALPGVYVYFQFFMLISDKLHLFEVSDSSASVEFETPAYGIPLSIVSGMEVRGKYNRKRLEYRLIEIWGSQDDIPYVDELTAESRPIYLRSDLEALLRDRKVAIFKYNKECYSLIKFRHQSVYDIAVVFDDAIATSDAADQILTEKTGIPVVNQIDQITDFDFDALILTCGFNYETEIVLFQELLRVALQRGIPIVSLYDDVLMYDIFDGIQIEAAIEKGLFYHTGVRPKPDEHIPPIANADTPENMLIVFGTDTVQGKFTTQIHLREALRKRVSVAHLATEPTGTLIAAEAGFSRIYSDDAELRLNFQRQLIRSLAEQHDLVISGGQNSMVFAPMDRTRRDNTSTRIFEESLPRYVVLTVAVDTKAELVLESIEYIAELSAENGITCQVIALSMLEGRKVKGARWTETYFTRVSDDLVQAARERFVNAVGLPLFVMPQEADQLAERVIQQMGIHAD